jgi:magnesium-protoporphyrin O-methyltransferase
VTLPGNCCEITDRAFSEKEAANEARSYRRKGPPGQTRELLKAVRGLGIRNAIVLDIGGGIGAIHHELLEDVAAIAIHVDASSAYLREARAEAERRDHTSRVTFVHADFTDVADGLPEADIVTLDRVVCCYPDFHRLLTAAALKSRRVLAMTYPRETWYTRVALSLENALQKLRGDRFRGFLHPIREMDGLLKDSGMARVFLKRLMVWELAVYTRIGAVGGEARSG